MEEWQRGNVQSSLVTGDEGRLGNLYVCLCLQGAMKTLITMFTKLKAYFKKRFTGYSTQQFILSMCT